MEILLIPIRNIKGLRVRRFADGLAERSYLIAIGVMFDDNFGGGIRGSSFEQRPYNV
jgi:hypothetical protein